VASEQQHYVKNKVGAEKEVWCGLLTNFALASHCWLQWTQPWL